MIKPENKRTTFTQKRLGSDKSLLTVSAIFAGIADLAVLVTLFLTSFDARYWLCPFLILIADLLLLATVYVTNYRMRYGVVATLLYVTGVAVMIAVYILLVGRVSVGTPFTHAAELIWIVVHGIFCIVILISTLNAAKFGRFFFAITAALVVGLVGATGYYTYHVVQNGFFGQGSPASARTLVYTYDGANDAYRVSGIVAGKGDTMVIPAVFNGKPVRGIDCSVFADSRLRRVDLDCGAEVEFTGLDRLDDADFAQIDVYTGKADVDTFKERLVRFSMDHGTKQSYLDFANAVAPKDLDAGEVYVTFAYTPDVLRALDGRTFDTWYGRAGDSFDLSVYTEVFPFVSHADEQDEEDLYWIHKNNDGILLRAVCDENGESVLDRALNESIRGVRFDFQTVYQLSVGDDNDDLYEPDADFRQLTVDGHGTGYRYVTAATAPALLTEISRDGFSLLYRFSTTTSSDRYILTDLASTLEQNDGVKIYPVWTLKRPTITAFSSDAANDTLTYGESVTLSGRASAPLKGLRLSYAWSAADGTMLGGNADLTLPLCRPDRENAYTLTVTAYSDTLTSLTSETVQTKTLTVRKRKLNFSWSALTDRVYDGSAKPVTARYDAADVVGGDEVTFTQSVYALTNAGEYRVKATLASEWAGRYEIADGEDQHSYAVDKKPVSIVWSSDTEFLYDGSLHSPTPTAEGILAGDGVDLMMTGAASGAGRHTARAVLSNDLNYIISAHATMTYTISPKPLTLTAKDARKTYDGTRFVDFAYEFGELAPTDTLAEILRIGGYGEAGNAVNAGTYAIAPTYTPGSKGGNYEITILNATLTIDRRPVSVLWSTESTFVYNGYPQAPAATADGLIGGDGVELLVKGASIDAGNYTATFALSDDRNYTLTSHGGRAYEIVKKPLTLTANAQSKTYDGAVCAGLSYSYGALAETDTLSEVIARVTYGAAATAVDAGTYDITLAPTPGKKGGNYEISVRGASLTIAKRPVTLTWQQTRSFEYDGTIKSPTATTEDLIAGDGEALRFVGGARDAGRYAMRAELSDGRNYAFAAGETARCDYMITPKVLTVSPPSETSFVYDGEAKTIAVTVSGVIDGDAAVEPVYTYYRYEQGVYVRMDGAPAQAGQYRAVIALDGAGNYALPEDCAVTFSIEAR